MPHLIDRCFAAAGVDGADLLDPAARRPDVPGLLRRRHRAAGAPRPRGDDRGDPHRLRRPGGGGLRTLLRLARPASTTSRCRRSSSAASTPRSTSPRRCGPALDLVRLGGVPPARQGGGAATSTTSGSGASSRFQSMYAGLAPYEALAIYAVITYMDTVNGVFVPEGGMHALPVALADGGREGRRHVPLRHPGRSHPPAPRARRARSPACGWPTARWSRPTPSIANPDLPVAYRTLLPGHADAAGGPSRALLAVGPRVARRRPRRAADRAPSTTTSTSAGTGTAPSGRSSATACACRIPSLLVSVPSLHEPTMAPSGRARALRPRAHPEPRRPASTGPTSAARPATTSTATSSGSGYPTDIEVEELVDPLDWEAQGMERGTPVRPLAPVPPDRVRSGPATSSGGRPAWCSPAPAPCPGVGVPMVLVSGMLAAQRVEEMEVR